MPCGPVITARNLAVRFLATEAEALLTRVQRVEPLSLHMPMLPAAAPPAQVRQAIDGYLSDRRLGLEKRLRDFLARLSERTPTEAQQSLTALRIRFNNWLFQYDLFADVLTQRSEHQTGVWLAGLDIAAEDALSLPNQPFNMPPMLCYLDRGSGGAIRRVSTPLPGGGRNPVSVIRVPRERMLGGALASSLVHEVGHEAAAQLELVTSFTPLFRRFQRRASREQHVAWGLWELWLSEVLADLWAVAKLGVAATEGLINVLSLPRAFVFRVSTTDPHPAPWIRVRLSCALGNALYPHPQWRSLSKLWSALYPISAAANKAKHTFSALNGTIDELVTALVNHRPHSLGGMTLLDAFGTSERQPAQLAACFRAWDGELRRMAAAPPTLVFAVLGQAKSWGWLSPADEGRMLAKLLEHWALRRLARPTCRCHSGQRPPL